MDFKNNIASICILLIIIIGNNEIFFWIIFICFISINFLVNVQKTYSNEDAKRLLDDKFSSYNSQARPVLDPKDKIELSIGLKLSQIADIVNKCFHFSFLIIFISYNFLFNNVKDEKNQIMSKSFFFIKFSL